MSGADLTIYLGFVGTGGVTTASGTTVTFITGTAAVFGLCSLMVGAPVFIAYGASSTHGFWTTVASVVSNDTTTPIFEFTTTDAVPNAKNSTTVIVYLPINQTAQINLTEPGPHAPPTAGYGYSFYIQQSTIDCESSLTTRPTLNFTIISFPTNPNVPFFPLVGQPVLMVSATYGRLFGGSVDSCKTSNIPGSNGVMNACQCVSDDSVLTRRLLMLTGAFAIGTNTDNFTGDGSTRTFNLTHYPSLIQSVTVNGVMETFGAYNSSAYLWWQIDTYAVEVNPAFATVPNGETLSIQYDAPGAQVQTPIYTNMTAGAIVTALCNLANNDGINIASTIETGPTVDSIAYTTQDTIDTALQNLITYISDGTNNYWYWMDAYKTLHFDLQGVTTTAPWNISQADGSDGNVLMQIAVTTSRDQFANAAWADIGTAIGNSYAANSWIGDGSTRSFNTTYGIDSVYSPAGGLTLFSGGTLIPQTVGLTGQTGFDWYFTVGDNTLTQDAGGTTLTTSQSLAFFYIPTLTVNQLAYNTSNILTRKNIEGGSGEWDLYVDLGQNNPVLSTATPAYNQAQYYANLSQVVEIVTYRGGLQSGQGITVDLPQIGINTTTFTVDQVKITEEDGLAKWTVTLNNGALVGGWKKAMVRVANLVN